MKRNPVVRALWRCGRRALGLLKWGLATTPALLGLHDAEKPRLLMIYDFSSQPFSVGDILIFQEASLVLREMHGLGAIDFALVYDPAKPVVPDPAFSQIDPKSFLFHLSSFLPAAQVNPHLGSIFLFNSHRHLEMHIADNATRYHVWPSLAQYAFHEYLYYYCFNELFYDYFRTHGALPNLASRPAAATWAAEFIRKHVHPAAAVTVQLRNNPVNPTRNSNYDSWIAFFRHCADRYPVKFILICARSEVDPRLKELRNLVIAKDFGTSVEQDLALIEAAHVHMGASSGPAIMALFSSKPYCIFNTDIKPTLVKGFTHEGRRIRFFFSAPLQNWIAGEETPELLTAEFDRLWTAAATTLRTEAR